MKPFSYLFASIAAACITSYTNSTRLGLAFYFSLSAILFAIYHGKDQK